MDFSMTFFVLGLPRSRTAWLANFLTYDDLFCYHEASNGCTSIDEYKEKVSGKGDSNTGLVFYKFEEHFPDAKIIIIDSSIDQSIQFGVEVFHVDVTEEMEIAKNRLDNIKGLHIKLEDINERLKDIWEYVSDKPFNKERADILAKMNIQVRNPLDIDYESISKFSRTLNVSTTLQ